MSRVFGVKLIALRLLRTRGQRLRGGAEHRLLDGPQRARVLAVERAKDVDGRAGHGALARDGINNAQGYSVIAAEAASGRHRSNRCRWGELGLDQCGHSGGEGDAEVPLGEAEGGTLR